MIGPQQPKTLSVPDAGRIYFGLSRNASYAAAARGDFPLIRIGKRTLRVSVPGLERMMRGEDKWEKPKP